MTLVVDIFCNGRSRTQLKFLKLCGKFSLDMLIEVAFTLYYWLTVYLLSSHRRVKRARFKCKRTVTNACR